MVALDDAKGIFVAVLILAVIALLIGHAQQVGNLLSGAVNGLQTIVATIQGTFA